MVLSEDHDKKGIFWPGHVCHKRFAVLAQIEKIVCKEATCLKAEPAVEKAKNRIHVKKKSELTNILNRAQPGAKIILKNTCILFTLQQCSI